MKPTRVVKLMPIALARLHYGNRLYNKPVTTQICFVYDPRLATSVVAPADRAFLKVRSESRLLALSSKLNLIS